MLINLLATAAIILMIVLIWVSAYAAKLNNSNAALVAEKVRLERLIDKQATAFYAEMQRSARIHSRIANRLSDELDRLRKKYADTMRSLELALGGVVQADAPVDAPVQGPRRDARGRFTKAAS